MVVASTACVLLGDVEKGTEEGSVVNKTGVAVTTRSVGGNSSAVGEREGGIEGVPVGRVVVGAALARMNTSENVTADTAVLPCSFFNISLATT